MNNFIFSLVPECTRSLLSAILIEAIWADGSQCFLESPSSPGTMSRSQVSFDWGVYVPTKGKDLVWKNQVCLYLWENKVTFTTVLHLIYI